MSSYSGAVVIPARNEAEYLPHTLEALKNQQGRTLVGNHAIVVVNNGSTDTTKNVVEEFGNTIGEFDLHILDEPKIGIQAACGTGFSYAIDVLGATTIARIDADTIPFTDWYQTILERFARQKSLALTGPTRPGINGDWHVADQVIVPAAKFVGHVIKSLRYGQPELLKFAPGYNMATSAQAFVEVGGFNNHETLTEDVAYNLSIAERFGWRAFGADTGMRVATSQRRVRAMGYIGAASYYLSDKEHEPR